MKKAIFIFSSPLQYLFSSLIAMELKKDYVIEGYSYFFQKDFTEIYQQINKHLFSPIQNIQNVKNIVYKAIQKDDIVLFANRFNNTEISVYCKASKYTSNLYLYEEGFSIYLPSHPHLPSYNDKNLRWRIENKLRILIGINPQFIGFNTFQKIYSVIKPDHLIDDSKWTRIIFNSVNSENSISNSCIFLLQALVEDKITDKETYKTFLYKLLDGLGEKYDTIYIKAHPRNSENLIETILSDFPKTRLLDEDFNDLPAEMFIAKHNLDVISFFNSTLVYAAELFNLATYQCIEEFASFSKLSTVGEYLNTVDSLIKKCSIKNINEIIKYATSEKSS